MARLIALTLVACLIGLSVSAHAQAGTQFKSGPDLRTSLNRGDRIAIELANSEQLTGIVGARLNEGFEIQLPNSAGTRFIKYRDVRALLDPDTREVVGYPTFSPDPVDRRWVGPVVISLAVVGVLALLTRGLFPACVFQRCN